MRRGHPILRARAAAELLLVAALVAAHPAAAQCTHELWTPDEMAADDMKLVIVNSTPFPVGSTWSLEACFSIANLGSSPETATFQFLAWDDSNTDLPFPITGFHPESITTPGNAARVECSAPGGSYAQIETPHLVPAGQLTDLCCFDFAAVPPGTCGDLIGQMTIQTLPPPINSTVFLRDRAQVLGETGSGGPVLDDTVELNGFMDISGPGCGLLGIEAVAPLALLVRRRRRRSAR